MVDLAKAPLAKQLAEPVGRSAELLASEHRRAQILPISFLLVSGVAMH